MVLAPAPVPPITKAYSFAGRIKELDGIRGLAIASVLIYHYAGVTIALPRPLYYLWLPTTMLWSGVDLFFVLSGFLIGGILLDNRDSPHYYSVFYARRIHRIFPIYYIMVALLFVGTWLAPQSALFRGTLPLWLYPLYAQNLVHDFRQGPAWLGPSWSLAVEEQFYLIFPFIVRLVSKKRLLAIMWACVIGAPLLRALLIIRTGGFAPAHSLLPCRADCLAWGVIGAFIVRSDQAVSWFRAHARWLYAALGFLVALRVSMLKWPFSYGGTIGYSLLAITFFLLIVLALVAPFPLLKNALTARWLCWLGTLSYCVYLIHQPVRIGLFTLCGLHEVGIAGFGTFLLNLAALGLTLGIAQLSWMILEKPLIQRARLRYQY